MAHYYFDLHEDDNVFTDEEGTSCSDTAGARSFAISAARDLIGSEAKNGAINMGYHISVRDDQGLPILKVSYREAVEISG
jgi:hypothetical protein